MTTTVTPESWARALLTQMGFPINANNVASILAWEYEEGGQFKNDAHWNPLNTQEGASTYGVAAGTNGIASYPNYQTGLNETVATLKGSSYAQIRHDLATSASPYKTAADIKASPWKTWADTAPGPVVERAVNDVKAHPAWAKPEAKPAHTTAKTTTAKTTHDPKGGSGPKPGASKPGNPEPGASKPGASKPGSSKPGSSQPAGGKSAGTSSGGDTVVLDLSELERLSRAYQNASDELGMRGARGTLMDLEDGLTQPLAELTDQSLAAQIKSLFAELTGAQKGFDSSSRQMDDLSYYTGEIRTLAEKADANGDGHYSPSEIKHFLGTDPSLKEQAPWVAVFEALEAGKIFKSLPTKTTKTAKTTAKTGSSDPKGSDPKGSDPKGSDPKGSKPGSKPKDGSKSPSSKSPGSKSKEGAGSDPKGYAAPGTSPARAKGVNAVISLAMKQHASEDDGNNVVKYNEWYGDPGQPWCATFISWVFTHAGHPLPAIDSSKGFDRVEDGIAYAKAHNQLVAKPEPGDVYLIPPNDHTGIVTKVYPDGSFDSIDGNYANQVSHVHHTAAQAAGYDFWRVPV